MTRKSSVTSSMEMLLDWRCTNSASSAAAAAAAVVTAMVGEGLEDEDFGDTGSEGGGDTASINEANCAYWFARRD